MKSVTIRNVPDEVHRAICVRAAQHGRSTEAEIGIGLIGNHWKRSIYQR